MFDYTPQKLGAEFLGEEGCRFRVWAPHIRALGVRLLNSDDLLPMEPTARGYYEVLAANIQPGERYLFRLDQGRERPDPASRFQPQGVHGPSEVIAPQFSWEDESWRGLPLGEYIIYELHVGAFTAEGTFESVIPRLDDLLALGVTAVELMPVAQFPGTRNWGYDGVYPFAAQNSYGGPQGLKTLVNACHRRGLAVILDVVYNHLGPEGNYLAEFGPYFTDRYKTPWGPALNFDGADSDEVRNFFLQNALQWVSEFHIDALRLDAVHAIVDCSPSTFLEQLAGVIHREAERLGRQIFMIAESADNNARLVRERERGGYGLDAQWNDDFHHCLRTLLTGELDGYYRDYGELAQLAKAYGEGFVYSGQYSPYRRRHHGSSSRDIPAERLVVFAQNHDQVGNRRLGDRLSCSASFEDLKLAAGLTLLAPFLPLLFMGEEYAEEAPFPYFVSHSDPELIEAVRQGRRMEFAAFQWQGEMPDPQAEATFFSAKLRHELRFQEPHKTLWEFYRELIRLRKQLPVLKCLSKDELKVMALEKKRVLILQRSDESGRAVLLANLETSQQPAAIKVAQGIWRKIIDSAQQQWRGNGTFLPDEIAAENVTRLTIAARSFGLFYCDHPGAKKGSAHPQGPITR